MKANIIVTVLIIACAAALISACALPTAGVQFHVVTFDPNDGEAIGTMEPQRIAVSETANLSSCGFTKQFYLFLGWATSGTGDVEYPDGAGYRMGDADVTLYAVWGKREAFKTVAFDAQGGSAVPPEIVLTGALVSKPSAPDWSAHALEGWFRESECVHRWDFATDTVASDMTLYAKWLECTDGLDYRSDKETEGYAVSKGTADTNGAVLVPAYWAGEMVTIVDDFAFADCSGLTEITLPDGIIQIKAKAFINCEKVKSIKIPDGVSVISEAAFYHCRSLTSVKLPAALVGIQNMVFEWCDNLTNLDFPDGLKYIGDQAFRCCANLTKVNIPDSVESIGSGAFLYCENLARVDLPAELEAIEELVFYHCDNLIDVSIPDSVSDIKKQAFQQCGKLQSLTLPSGLIHIGTEAFKDCGALETVTLKAIDPPALDYFGFAGCANLARILVPAASLDAYKMANIWENYADIIFEK